MAKKYTATNILTGVVAEGTAQQLADVIMTSEASIYNASYGGFLFDRKWKITVSSSQFVYKKTCKICGNEYETAAHNQKYCGDECRAAQKTKNYMPMKMSAYKKRAKDLNDIATEARKAGMTYGQYVAQMGL